jgi:hypothetical protein
MSHLNEVDSLIADLWRTKGETSWWSPNRSRRLAAIRSLAEQATWRQLPQLVMLLQYAETAESAVFQDACSAILQRTLPNELPALDQAMRSSYYGDQFVYHSIDKDMLLRLIGTGEARTPLLKLATMVANGYVREAALRRLVLSGDPEVVIFLLLRANDWVLRCSSSADF